MSRLWDFFIWLGEIAAGASAPRPPPRVLAIRDEEPVLLRWEDGEYHVERAARAGDAAPLLLGRDQAMDEVLTVPPEAALHGAGAARIEATRLCPFPLDSAVWRLAREPVAWTGGAAWRFSAAPRRRIDDIAARFAAIGARPGRPVVERRRAPPFDLAPRRSRLVPTAAAVMLAAMVAAAVSAPMAANRVGTAAETRLAAARTALEAAESEAEDAAARRDAAGAPIRAAREVEAILTAAPPVGAALIAVTRTTPDNAYFRRLSIRPGAVAGEASAPDAAAFAALLARDAAFASARLKSAARAEASTGRQRAMIEAKLAP